MRTGCIRWGAAKARWSSKFYRPARWSDAQIAEEHAFTAELAAAEMAVAAPLNVGGRTLFRFEDFRFAVFPWLRGRSPELDAPEARAMLGAQSRAAPSHRRRAAVPGAAEAFGGAPRLSGRASRCSKAAFCPPNMEESYLRATDTLLERVERVFEEVGPTRQIRLHGDCHLGNLLWDEHGPVFVDLDDCMTGPAIQDLWMLLSGPAAEQQSQWRDLIEGYEQFGDARLRRAAADRAASRCCECATTPPGSLPCWSDPAFPRAFPWFGGVRYWEEHVNDLLAQAAAVDDPPLLERMKPDGNLRRRRA